MDIASIRSDLDVTQAEFAKLLGVSPGHVGDLERGHRKLTIKLAHRLEEITQRSDIVATVVSEKRSEANAS